MTFWSGIELTTGVVVACLPAARQLLRRFAPSLKNYVSTCYTSGETTTVSKGTDATALGSVRHVYKRTSTAQPWPELVLDANSTSNFNFSSPMDRARGLSEPLPVLTLQPSFSQSKHDQHASIEDQDWTARVGDDGEEEASPSKDEGVYRLTLRNDRPTSLLLDSELRAYTYSAGEDSKR